MLPLMLITGLILWASIMTWLIVGLGFSLMGSTIGAMLIVVSVFMAGFWSGGRK